ncbi:MAG: Gfo/Idh/MocA family oxidoreductase, partial [Verrucomicrobiota bacterium]|nr:Gfo/Idh/MocA family oxidoreductase [Verrucomicrobiota bacterium]
MSRRLFLKRAAKAGAATIALPALVPGSALGLDGAVAPSNRIVFAGIGLGGRGSHDLGWLLTNPEVQMVAICDVKKQKREQHKNTIDKHHKSQDCKTYIEMMDVLTRPDIDAILTATSDRLHATVSIRAMRNGKDVYTEKPASMFIAEGQAVVETARQYGRVYQAGMQRLSEANFIVCNELLRLGRLGEVKTVYAHLAPWGNVNMSRD